MYAPERIHLSDQQLWADESGLDLAVDLVMEDGRYVVEQLTATRAKGGPPITGVLLRKIAVQDFIEEAVVGYVGERDDEGNPVPLRFTAEDLSRLRGQGPVDETLRCVAMVYVIGRLIGTGSAKNVAGVLGIPLPTANNWIRRAKDRGFIDG